jgi:DinB family protein
LRQVATESEAFQGVDVDRFLDDLRLVERDALVARLEAAGPRLAALAERIPESPPAAGEEWNAKQVLAHLAALSKLYGMLTYRVGTGALTEFDLMAMVNQRDAAGAALAQLPVAELVGMIHADHARTLAYVRSALPEQLERRCRFNGERDLSAGEILRLPLVAHVEQHLSQLEAALP